MNKWMELLIGLILIIAPILVAWYSHVEGWSWDFWSSAILFFQGGIFWFLIIVGLLFLLLGLSDLKNTKK